MSREVSYDVWAQWCRRLGIGTRASVELFDTALWARLQETEDGKDKE